MSEKEKQKRLYGKIPSELTKEGEGKIDIVLTSANRSCFANIYGRHEHIYSKNYAYCPKAERILYIGE